jgi:hypothetical protein
VFIVLVLIRVLVLFDKISCIIFMSLFIESIVCFKQEDAKLRQRTPTKRLAATTPGLDFTS